MASSDPTKTPSAPYSSQVPVSQFIDLDHLGTTAVSKASAVLAAPPPESPVIYAPQPVHYGLLVNPMPQLSHIELPDKPKTPIFNYDNYHDHDHDQQSAPAPASSAPPASDSDDSDTAHRSSAVNASQSDVPRISFFEDEKESEANDSSMFFFTAPRADAKKPPAVLKKTRGRPQEEPVQSVRQNAVSMPLHHKLQPSEDLPPAHALPRGRSVSARPHISVDSVDSADTASPVSPALADQHQQQQPQQQYQHHPQDGHEQSRHNEAPASLGPRSQTTNSSEGSASLTSASASLSPMAAAPRSDRRRSWLPGLGSRLRSKSHEPSTGPRSQAWILSADSSSSSSQTEYNTDCLVNGDKVPELWDDNGSLYVYLSSPDSGKSASFRVHPSTIEHSRVLSSQVQTEGGGSSPAADAQRMSCTSSMSSMSSPWPGSSECHLYLLADGKPELERLIALRNLFALLTGQALVATKTYPTMYAVLLKVAELLHEFEFGYDTGSDNSFGDAVDISTVFYVDHNGLADVRFNHEKTLEALVLGEKLRLWPLYNEAFCHAVGKYPALRHLKKSPNWAKISPNTLQRLERAHLDLVNRQNSVNLRLEQFDFPSLFAGVGNSTSNIEYRNIRFKNWRASFSDMRSFVLKYYKAQFGSWPPKASSRRNTFSESGLNRLVLRTMYIDLCAIYDLLVDRTSRTTRAGEDGSAQPMAGQSAAAVAPLPTTEASVLALRQILSEFDQSSPPVLPPVPYDTPILPTMAALNEKFAEMPAKEQARFQRHVHSADLQVIMGKSHNADAERASESSSSSLSSSSPPPPFLAAFEAFELREAKSHRTEAELTEMRIGHWLFLYVVLQSMPMLVIDAPGLQYTEGVEYFLCEPPQGRAPWVEDAGEVRKAWFQTAGGAGPLVELSADVLLYSVEATYHRSHCWLAAATWDSERAALASHSSLAQPLAQPAAESMPYAMQPVASMGSMLSVTSMHHDSLGGSPVVTLPPDLPMGSINSGRSGGSLGSASAMGLASPVSFSNPSLATLATRVSATDSSVTATGSNTSSPQIVPTLYSEGAGAGAGAGPGVADYDLARPATSASAFPNGMNGPNRFSQYSPTLVPVNHMGQPMPALSLPQLPQTPPSFQTPPRRENYHELQERANLRHASIGWALEPVRLEPARQEPVRLENLRLEDLQSGQDDFQKPVPAPFANTRRVASAGNLRVMTDLSGNANYASNMDQKRDSASVASPGGLTIPGVTFNSDSTFDSILGSMDADASKKVNKRRSFLPFM